MVPEFTRTLRQAQCEGQILNYPGLILSLTKDDMQGPCSGNKLPD